MQGGIKMQVGEFKKILEEYPDDMWLEFHVETEDREVYSYVNKGNYSHMGTRCIITLRKMSNVDVRDEFPMIY